MKVRLDHITNSSTSMYIVYNKTNHTKTMLDLLEEAANGEWEIAYEHGAREELGLQRFNERVEKIQSFPPYSINVITIAWGDGGPIFCPGGLHSETKSFITVYFS